MANVAKNAIMRAKLEGVLSDLMIKTNGEMVYLDESTTLAAKLSEMITAINARAKSADVTTEISNAVSTAKTDIKSDYTSAISKAIADLIDSAPETYDTLKEIADYIASDKTAMEALTEAIGAKVAKADLGSLAYKSAVSDSDLEQTLKTKIDNASAANHSHDNKTVLDGITSTKVTNWDAAASAKHSHSNKTALDGITADKVTAWDGKSKIYYSATQPDNLQEGDLWVQLID
jgi:hypothetical protein